MYQALLIVVSSTVLLFLTFKATTHYFIFPEEYHDRINSTIIL